MGKSKGNSARDIPTMNQTQISPSDMGTTGLIDYVLAGSGKTVAVKSRFPGYMTTRSAYWHRHGIALRVLRRRFGAHYQQARARFDEAIHATSQLRITISHQRQGLA